MLSKRTRCLFPSRRQRGPLGKPSGGHGESSESHRESSGSHRGAIETPSVKLVGVFVSVTVRSSKNTSDRAGGRFPKFRRPLSSEYEVIFGARIIFYYVIVMSRTESNSSAHKRNENFVFLWLTRDTNMNSIGTDHRNNAFE